jgi:AmmeMemoRadiSam system protein B
VAAGSFYPNDAAALLALVDRLLAGVEHPEAEAPSPEAPAPEALIVPHAGYLYSGPVAATAYARVRSARSAVVLGPAHFVPLGGCAVPAADAWATPLGEVAIDPDLRDAAVASGARIDDGPHEPEHSLEVQLPFLQRILEGGFTLLPVAVGVGEAGDVADLIEALSDPPERLVIVSTDLSHYHDAQTAERLDGRTADAVLDRDPAAIGPFDACGVFALRGIVEHARRRDIPIRLLDLRNSADTGGDPSSVVGYGAFCL